MRVTKNTPARGQPGEPGEVEVAAIEDQNRAGRKGLLPRHRDLVPLAFGDHEAVGR